MNLSFAVPMIHASSVRIVLNATLFVNLNGTVGAAKYQQTVLTAFQQVEDNLASLRILEDEAERQRRAVEAARESEKLSFNRYKGGLVTYLEVVTAQSIRLQNERVAVGVERRRLEASVLLIRALGGGWNASSLPQPAELTEKTK